MVHPKVTGRDKEFIIYVDQTPIPFTFEKEH